MKFDAREMQRCFQLYGDATKKDEEAILNRAGRNATIKAYRNTSQAVAARIRGYLSAENFRMAGIILAKRGKLRGLTRKQQAVVVRRFVAASVRSVRYIKVGWARAGQAFGAFGSAKVNPRSEAAKGYGVVATPGKLVAVIVNNSRGADVVGKEALESALMETAADMAAYAAKKMGETARRFSARG